MPDVTRGERRHLVRFQNPGPGVPDGDGGFTRTWVDTTPPTWFVSIEPATAQELERTTAGTVISSATHIIKGDYLAGVTTQTRILFGARTLNVTGVANPEERNLTMILTAVEVVT